MITNAQTGSLVRLSVALSLWAITLLCAACDGERPVPIEGIVATMPDLPESSIVSSRVLRADAAPLSGATIYLSQSMDHKEFIPGTVSRSDNEGRYRIDTTDLPPPTRSEGYVIVVEKDGYEPLLYNIRVGSGSALRKNTVYLKPKPKGKERERR
jgi:hypothetical protein